jgi:hypothetical protein
VIQGNARTISDFFIDEPGHILPLLDKRVKMDMIDYENEGIKKEFNNAFGEGSHITSMSDSHISVKVSNSSSVEMLLIPCKKDSVILTISTFAIPAKDSRVECFNTSWGKIDSKKYFKAPTMNDFIVIPKGDKTKKKTILEAIEFPIIYYSLNNDGTITARHSLKEYMSKEDFDKIAPYLKDEIIVNIKK